MLHVLSSTIYRTDGPFILCCRDWKAIVDDWIAATKATMDSDSSEC